MKHSSLRLKARFTITGAVLCAMLGFANVAQAVMLKVSVSNNAALNGFSFTPLFASLHSAAFDAFDAGGTASPGLKSLAELGIPGTLRDEHLAADPNSVGGAVFPDGAMRPLFSGEIGSQIFNITDPSSNMFFTFSRILPSNDTFFGRDNALQIFNTTGGYVLIKC
ncbi:MAG: spondin domain-containing protein [Motiliproteus sp.]